MKYMLNYLKAIFERLPHHLTPLQHIRNLSIIGSVLLIIIGVIAGWNVFFAIISVIIGGLAALIGFDRITSQSKARGPVKLATEKIRNGAQLFLLNAYKNLLLVSVALAVLVGFGISWSTGIGYLFGVLLSILAGFLCFNLCMNTRLATLNALSRHLLTATQLAMCSGIICGFAVMGIAVLGLAIYYTILVASQTEQMISILTGIAVGAASVSLFLSIGGSIFVQTGVAVCQLGKKSMKADDLLSQPFQIIHSIAENVNECAIRFSDSFSTLVAALVASIVINTSFQSFNQLTAFPLLVAGIAILSSILVLRILQETYAEAALEQLIGRIFIASAVINTILVLLGTWWVFDPVTVFEQVHVSVSQLYNTEFLGLGLTVLLFFLSQRLLFNQRGNQQLSIFDQYFDLFLLLLVGASIFIAHQLAGVLGVELLLISFLTLYMMVTGLTNFSYVLGQTGANLAVSPQTADFQRMVYDSNAMTQIYQMVGSALTAVLLVYAAISQVSAEQINTTGNVAFISGLLIGVVSMFAFSVLLIYTSHRVTNTIVPASASRYAIVGMVKRCQEDVLIPAFAPVLIAILFTVLFGRNAANGLAIGAGACGLLLGFVAARGGFLWEFQKSYINQLLVRAKVDLNIKPEQQDSLEQLQYRQIIISIIGPMVKMIAVLALFVSL